MLIIAHRGASSAAPENTLPAFDLALVQGADGLEFDVRLAACGTPVIIHDETLLRTHGLPERVDAMDAKALEALGVPLLATVLWRYVAEMRLFVEAKTADAALAAAAQMELLLASGVERDALILISFDHEALARAKDLYPALTIGASYGSPPDVAEASALPCMPRWLPVRAECITAEIAQAARSAGLSLVAWTVNTQEEANRLHALGIDALMTDFPVVAREWIP